MKIVVNAKELTDIIKDITKGVEQVQSLTFEASKGLVVTAQNAGKVIALRVKDAKISEKGLFTVKPEVLVGLLKNRKELEMELKDACVAFKAPSSKSYSGNFVTLPDEKISMETEATNLNFTDEFIATLNTIVPAVSINDVHLGKMNPLPVFIKLSSKGAEFSCANDSHMAYARMSATKFKSDALMCLPAGTIPMMNSIAKNQAYKLSVTESSIFASNESFRYRVPLEQFDQAISLDDAKGLIKQLKGEKSSGCITVKTAELAKTLDNLMSVYEENVPVEFLIKEDSLRIRTKTNSGSVSDTLKGKDSKDMKIPVNVHPQVLGDILLRAKSPTITIMVVPNKCLMIETKVDGVEYIYSCILL